MYIDDDIFKEILAEVREENRKIQLLIEKQNFLFEEVLQVGKGWEQPLQQMAYYLSDFQSVVDFSLKDASKFNEKLLRELKVHFTKLAALFAPDLVGASRPNYKPTSSEDDPVYTQNKDYLIHMAEITAYGTQTTNRAYYNIGYRSSVGTSYTALDEGYSTQPVTAQNVNVVSDSAMTPVPALVRGRFWYRD